MLEAAFDAGIRHYDAAPLYGFGQAESCLGEFLGRHRGEVTVTTKYGLPPAKNPGLIGIARSLARPVVRLLPGLKRGLSQAAGKMTANAERASFTAAEAKASLDRSLAELKTDRIDVWLLHEATADDLRDDGGLLEMLEDAVRSGTIGAFGVGSEREKVRTLAIKRPKFCGVVQFEWSVLDAPVEGMPGFRIHHRALTDHFRALWAELTNNAVRCAAWSKEVGSDLADASVLASLMLKASLVENAGSVVLFSSKDPAHMRKNVEVAGDASLEAPAKRLYGLVRAAVRELREIEAGG